MEQVQLEQWLAVTHQEKIVLLVFLSQSNIAYCTIKTCVRVCRYKEHLQYSLNIHLLLSVSKLSEFV